MRGFIKIIMLLFLQQIAIGQTILTGIVSDASKEPIIGATVTVYDKGELIEGAVTDYDGRYSIKLLSSGVYDVKASYIGFNSTTKEDILINDSIENVLNFEIYEGVMVGMEICIVDYKIPLIEIDNACSGTTVTAAPTKRRNIFSIFKRKNKKAVQEINVNPILTHDVLISENRDRETYDLDDENKFIRTEEEALSTFSIDVDRASYSNIRRLINQGHVPTSEAVRIEEMINYFDYNYPSPKDNQPFAIHHEVMDSPWNKENKIVQIALQGERINTAELPPSNFVFLIDVSGSMQSANKLGLVKSSIKILMEQLKEDDRVAIVVYAGAAGLVLESTPVSEKEKIMEAVQNLRAGGSTAGGAGIKLAYKTAKEHFMEDGNNRIILATDGDFNVGINNPESLVKLVEKEREGGVFLSVLGYGTGNYRDDMMQKLADNGNGNHNYIDNIQEARKVLAIEFAGTMYTLAKDVKIQIEFNPAQVKAYRLIGYVNRMLEKEDFNDDKKDAGELGKGHSVTALYEIVPQSSEASVEMSVDPLKYQQLASLPEQYKDEVCTIKLRHKSPTDSISQKTELVITTDSYKIMKTSKGMKFAVAVAGFGMILRESKYINSWDYNDVIKLAKKNKSHDPEGYKKEFIRLVESCELLDTRISMD